MITSKRVRRSAIIRCRAGEPRSSGASSTRVPDGTRKQFGNCVAWMMSSSGTSPFRWSMRPGRRSMCNRRWSTPRRTSPSMIMVRCPISANTRARCSAMNDLPSDPPGLVIVNVTGPAAPYAYPRFMRTPRIESRNAGSVNGPSAVTRVCGREPRIVTPISRETCSGYRNLGSRRSRRMAPTEASPNPAASATSSTRARVFLLG